MAKFIAMTLEGGSYRGVEILTRGSLAEMFRPQNRDVPLDFGFEIGLNWMIGRPSVAHGRRVLRHDGGSPHFFSIVVVLPDAGLGVVVLSNPDGGMVSVGLIADAVLNIALAEQGHESASFGRSDGAPLREGPHVQDSEKELPQARFATPSGIVRIERGRHAASAVLRGRRFSLLRSYDGWHSLGIKIAGFFPVRLKALGAPSPCNIHCLDPMEGMVKGLAPAANYRVESTLWTGERCRVVVTG